MEQLLTIIAKSKIFEIVLQILAFRVSFNVSVQVNFV